MAEIIIHQDNTDGTNNIYILLELEKALRPYDKELSVGVEKMFLDDASENLIRDKKLYLNEDNIIKVKHYLDDKKFCLIKAPEGRGKTYLSRIIAYDYHTIREMKVFFLDLKRCNSIPETIIDNKLQEWHKDKNNNYLIVIENVHAHKYLNELVELINQWINLNDNHIWFLLNSRPTDDELDLYSDREEIVELKPDKDDVNGIIDLYSKEVHREPFANNKERDDFVEKICPDKKKASGANLRLLRIYLKTWQNHPEIQFISSVSEKMVINDFRKMFLSGRAKDDIMVLWYISCLYQFDVPLYADFVSNAVNINGFEGLLRFEGNRYHLPHSVDATFLYKAICDYKGKNYVSQMRIFAERFINDILATDCPNDFESDFILFNSGLRARSAEYKNVIYYIHKEDIAEIIIKKINSAFVSFFFHPKNHENSNPDELINYYHNNKNWLIPIFKEIPAFFLSLTKTIFQKHFNINFNINIVKDIFEDAKELDEYLKNDKHQLFFYEPSLIDTIAELSEEHRTILINNYEKNKASLKPKLLELGLARLNFVHKVYKKHFNIDIVKYIFEDAKDMDDYLKNDKNLLIFYKYELIKTIAKLGKAHRTLLINYYEKNKASLKPKLLEFGGPTWLYFVHKVYKKHLKIDIVKDIFEDAKDLDNFLKNDKNHHLFIYDEILNSITKLGAEHQQVLDKNNVFNYFFYTKPAKYSFRICQGFIHQFWNDKKEKNNTFDVTRIKNNRFYLDGVSWAYLQMFVSIIRINITERNRQQSINMVKTIMEMVLAKENAFSYATALNLSYFCYNIASVDEAIFQELAGNQIVQTDIKRRLEASSYSFNDLNLFGYFFSQDWCKEKLSQRLLNADNAQQQIIKEWHDKIMTKMNDNGKGITSGSLLDYIHNHLVNADFPSA